MAQTAYDKAIYLLSSREHTRKELREKLSLKGYPAEEIALALERLEKENYLSEERYAEVFIRSRLKKSPEGKSLLMMRIAEKGVPRDIARNALEEAWGRKDYLEPLQDALQSYTGKKGEAYAIQKMQQKGFSVREIREAMGIDA